MEDDGSLPSVEFACLSPISVRSVVDFFRRHGTITTKNATLHDSSCDADVPIDQCEDPAGLVLSGVTDSFHCCFGGMSHSGVPIPVLGLFVFGDCVQIDYRMGTEWNPENVDAFFRLLVQLKSLAPEAIVGSAENEGLPYPEDFKTAFNQYAEMQRA
jgi:hypothetical protein